MQAIIDVHNDPRLLYFVRHKSKGWVFRCLSRMSTNTFLDFPACTIGIVFVLAYRDRAVWRPTPVKFAPLFSEQDVKGIAENNASHVSKRTRQGQQQAAKRGIYSPACI